MEQVQGKSDSSDSRASGVVITSREEALLDGAAQNAQWSIAMGALAGVAAVLLLEGMASSVVGLILGGGAVIAAPSVAVWRNRESRRGKQSLGIYVALMLLLLVAQPLVHHDTVDQVGKILGWVGLLFCPVGIGVGWNAARSLPAARRSLTEPAFDILLEIAVQRGYGGMPYTSARLWSADSATPDVVARFGWQYSEPPLTAVNHVMATVHGAPTKGAVVVVSSSEAVLVGRIRRSHFGEQRPPRHMPALPGWLIKPRAFHLR